MSPEREPGMIYLLVRSEIITSLLGSESRFGRRGVNFEMLEQMERAMVVNKNTCSR